MATCALQMALGVATLLLGVPLALAAAHQAGAVALLAAALFAAHAARRNAETEGAGLASAARSG